jgi:rhomboid protease GluP
MFGRQTSGSVVCVACGYLVGVNDDRCYHCGRRNPGLWGFAPAIRHLGHDLGFVPFVTGACIIVYVLTLLTSGGVGLGGGIFGMLAPSGCATLRFGASGADPVFILHRWWTVLSASWLHGSALHILFNILWIRQLAPDVAELYGPGRTVIIYTVAGISGFALTSTVGYFTPFGAHGLTVGASAAIFGLLGALVHYGRRAGSRVVHSQAMYYAVVLFIFGLVMASVDNFAHAGGFAGGWLAARVLDPLKPERINHLLIALVCLAASILSILLSLVMSTAPYC